MQKQTLQQQLKEINNSTLHNMRFLLESYSNEVLEAIESSIQSSDQEEVFQSIRRDVSSVINMLRGIETVINHNTYIYHKEAS